MVEFLVAKDYPVKKPVFQFPDNAGIDGYIPSNTEEFRKALIAKNPDLFVSDYSLIDFGTIAAREENRSILLQNGEIYVAPHSSLLIPSGLYMKIPADSALIDFNKSGIATKKKLVVGACIIDYSYQGIIHYHIINTSNDYQLIKCDEKIMQMVEVKIGTGAVVYEDLSVEQFFTEKSSRGTGGFGSTGLQ